MACQQKASGAVTATGYKKWHFHAFDVHKKIKTG
jgi:hypothetical protein